MPLDQFYLNPGLDLLLGCGGVLYQPRLLNLGLLTNITMLQQRCFHVDDVRFEDNSNLHLWNLWSCGFFVASGIEFEGRVMRRIKGKVGGRVGGRVAGSGGWEVPCSF